MKNEIIIDEQLEAVANLIKVEELEERIEFISCEWFDGSGSWVSCSFD